MASVELTGGVMGPPKVASEPLIAIDAIERAFAIEAMAAADRAEVAVDALVDDELVVLRSPLPIPLLNVATGLASAPHRLADAEVRLMGATGATITAAIAGIGDRRTVGIQSVWRSAAEMPSGNDSAETAHTRDAATWAAVVAASSGFDPRLASEWNRFASELAQSPSINLWLSWVGGSPAGAALVFRARQDALLAFGAVLPAYRGRGVHRRLIVGRLTDLARSGATGWAAAQADGASHRNLARCGLQEVGRRAVVRLAWTGSRQ